MRISLSPETLDALEELTETKITRNGDAVIQKVCEMAEESKKPNSKCWVELEAETKKEDADAEA